MPTTLSRIPVARTLQAASLGVLAGIGVQWWRRHQRPAHPAARCHGDARAMPLRDEPTIARPVHSDPTIDVCASASQASASPAFVEASGTVGVGDATRVPSVAPAPAMPVGVPAASHETTEDEVRRRSARLGIDEWAARHAHESRVEHLEQVARVRGRGAFAIAKAAVSAWVADGCMQQGAAIAYYTIFAIAPLMLIVLTIATLALGDEAANGQIYQQIGGLVGDDAARGIQGIIVSSQHKPGQGAFGAIVSVVTALVGASAVFVGLKAAFDAIYHPVRRDESTVAAVSAFMRARLVAIAIVLALGFLVVVTLILSTAMAALGAWLGGFAPWLAPLMTLVDLVISTAGLTVAFWMLIRFLPERSPNRRAVWTGAFVSAVLFAVGKHLIGLYLARGAVASAYGAAGSLIVIVVWVYYSTQILLLGAEVAKAIDEPAARTARVAA